jgi:adenosylhomocysteine nucleosidase
MVFRSLFRNWLRNTAREKMRQKVFDAARAEISRQRGDTEGGETDEAARLTCDVGVVFALGIEAGGLRDLLADEFSIRGHGFVARFGKLKGRDVVVIQSGAGQEAAARATDALITAHRPPWVISAGFAGGLCPEVKRHDVVMANSVMDTHGNRLGIDLKVDPESLAQIQGVHLGPVLTADRIVRLPAEKRELGDRHRAMAVDMESFAVAEVCRRQHVRFLAVRIIGDSVDEALPADVEKMLNQKTGSARLGAAAGALWKRPGSIKDMFKLKENALVASDRLAKFLVSTIDQLPPPQALSLRSSN